MSEDQFWALIDAARREAGDNLDERVSALGRQLHALSLEGIQAFQNQYDRCIHQAYRWDLWGAAYLMNGGCSDDGFLYFCHWLISEGRARFQATLADPDSLAEIPRRDYFDLELFAYEAPKAFEAKGGGELERDYNIELATPEGEEWDEDELPKLFPRLAAKYAS
ncbi:DUF4240 domain-containing protein [Mitsuaria sp. WAJ17]|nr:DUF4240 domain-containing protein [Mitsuaria sp. WAJ17]